MQAALDQHYAEHPDARPTLADVERRTLDSMPNDAPQLLIGLAALILLAVSLGTVSARIFMSASRDPQDGSNR